MLKEARCFLVGTVGTMSAGRLRAEVKALSVMRGIRHPRLRAALGGAIACRIAPDFRVAAMPERTVDVSTVSPVNPLAAKLLRNTPFLLGGDNLDSLMKELACIPPFTTVGGIKIFALNLFHSLQTIVVD